MSIASSNAPSNAPANAAQLDQLYVTYCDQGDSVRNQPGFHVRASSTSDLEVLKFAFDYPGYELPIDMWGKNPSPEDAPRRLARVRAPGHRTALLHSTYVPESGRSRAGNYFTHILIYPHLAAVTALQHWGSPDWTTSYAPGAPRRMGPCEDLPRPGGIDDEVLANFLSASGRAPSEQNLATVIFPERLAAEPARRQELLRWMLRGCLLVLGAEAGDPRGRLYVLAEPGLTALLLYGVARLLPSGLVDELTFSTYESLDNTLRQFRLAQVVGTFSGNAQKGLDGEFFTTRGYALDTFNPEKSSSELRGREPGVVDELVALAMRGDWHGVDELHRLCGKQPVTIETLASAAESLELLRRLTGGKAQPRDFLTLCHSTAGRAFLAQHHDRLWPQVSEWSLTDEAVREAAVEMLRKHVPEIKLRTMSALAAGSVGDWQRYWGLLRVLLADAPEKRRQHFLGILDAAGADMAMEPALALRVALLREWQGLQAHADDLPAEVAQLLVLESAVDLAAYQRGGLPARWLGAALADAVVEAGGAAALDLLTEVDDNSLGAFCQVVNEWPWEQQQETLPNLLPRGDAHSLPLLGRLLQSGLRLPAETLDDWLEGMGAYEHPAAEFWLQGNHLSELLESLRDQGKPAERVWNRFCSALTRRLLLGYQRQQQLLHRLRSVSDRLGPDVPASCRTCIEDWTLLRDAITHPGNLPAAAQAALAAACDRRGLAPLDLLTEHFAYALKHQQVSGAFVEAFALTLKAFHPECHQFQDFAGLFRCWLQIVHACPDLGQRAELQLYFLEHHVPVAYRLNLAQQLRQQDLLSSRVLQAVQRMAPPEPVVDVIPAGRSSLSAVQIQELPSVLPVPPPVYQPVPKTSAPAPAGLIAALIFVSVLAVVLAIVLLFVWNDKQRPVLPAAPVFQHLPQSIPAAAQPKQEAERFLHNVIQSARSRHAYVALTRLVASEAMARCGLTDGTVSHLLDRVLDTYAAWQNRELSPSGRSSIDRITDQLIEYVLEDESGHSTTANREHLRTMFNHFRDDLQNLEPNNREGVSDSLDNLIDSLK
jgi:hypothetical protein